MGPDEKTKAVCGKNTKKTPKSDDGEKSPAASRVPHLDMNHGFIKSIVRNQISRLA